MPNVIDSLLVKLKFDVEHKGLHEFEQKIHGIHGALEKLGGLALFETAKRIGEFVEHAVEAAAGIQEFSETTGIAVEEIDALRRVATETGVRADAMQESMYGIMRATGAAAAGFPRYTKLFQQLGISAKDSSGHVKDSATMMAELSDKFHGMDAGLRMAVAGRLGIDPRLAALMAEEGGEGMREKIAGARGKGILRAEDFEQAHEAEKTFTRLKATIEQVTTLVAVRLAPWVEKVLNTFMGWWKANRGDVIQKFEKGLKQVAEVVEILWRLLSTGKDLLVAVYEKFDKLGITTGTVLGILTAIAAVKLQAWLLSAAAGVAGLAKSLIGMKMAAGMIGFLAIAVALLVEDIYQFMTGGDSVTGRLQEKWSGAFNAMITVTYLLGSALGALLIKAGLAAAGITAGFSAILLPLMIGLVALYAWYTAAEALIDAWGPVKQWFSELWDGIIDGAKKVGEYVLRYTPLGWSMRANAAMVGNSTFSDFLESQDQKHNDQVSRDQNESYQSQRYAPSSVDAQGRGVWAINKASNKSVAVKVDKIEISADKGRESTVGNQFSSQIESAYSSAERNASSPVDY